MKEWFNSKELAGVGGLPNSPSNVTRKAKSLSWEFRKVEGVKGVSYEFFFNSLPEEVQAELLLKQSQAVEIPKAKKELNFFIFYRTLFSSRTRFTHHNFDNLSVDMLHAF
ncbi:DNA-binding protein [Haemophilus haemolyticus]|uniref:DNA-binding protein n=1 Tax=Haemophilus haemolyticus TaxID=726 RepID=UPI000E571A99|nr:DNA-binding protein [Haemophilus haemolyticus]